jgi:hypothetical protein
MGVFRGESGDTLKKIERIAVNAQALKVLSAALRFLTMQPFVNAH